MKSVEEVKSIIEAVTGAKVDEPRAKRVADVLNAFEGFVESGGSIKSLTDANEIARTVGVFQEFVYDRGGTLARNEVWAIVAFLAWCERGFALHSEEAEKYRAFKELLNKQAKTGTVEIKGDLANALSDLMRTIIGGKK